MGDILSGQKTHNKTESMVKPSAIFNAGANKEKDLIPSVVSLYGIGHGMTVKFSTADGVVTLSDPGAQINPSWTYVKYDDNLSVIVMNSATKKTYRVTMKAAEDVEFGQREKQIGASPVEMSIPPMPPSGSFPAQQR